MSTVVCVAFGFRHRGAEYVFVPPRSGCVRGASFSGSWVRVHANAQCAGTGEARRRQITKTMLCRRD